MSLLALQIAGVRLDLDVGGTAPAGLDRYRPFAEAAGPPDWEIELLPETFAPPTEPGRRVIERRGNWAVAGAEEAGWLDPSSGTGVVRRDPDLLLLDALLRSAVGTEILDRGGLLLHGAAVVVDGAAHLFPARSGSGKSTLAGRARHPLSDEVSVLEPGDGGFVARATPWWTTRGGSAPLVGVYGLVWDAEGVTPLRCTAIRQLVTNMVLPLDTPANRGRGLAAAAAVAGCVPFGRFAFRRDSDVDALLRGAAGRLLGG